MDITLERILSLIPKKENGDFKHGAKKAFATSLGFKDGTIVTIWISGSSDSYKNYLYQISELYNVSVEWLKGETDQKEKPTPENGSGQISPATAELLGLLDGLSEEQVRRLEGIVRAAKDLL
jgi:hypothetical protein